MADLGARIQKLIKESETMKDEKRTYEIEIEYKEKRLAEAKASLSEKGVDYEDFEGLKEEIKDKTERIEQVVSNMERALSSADVIEKPIDKPIPSIPEDMFAGLGI